MVSFQIELADKMGKKDVELFFAWVSSQLQATTLPGEVECSLEHSKRVVMTISASDQDTLEQALECIRALGLRSVG